MNILTVENETYELDTVPDEVDGLRYCVLDCSDKEYVDHFFMPLVFLETFYAPCVVLKIGEYSVKMPLDWSILVCDETYADMEVIPITSLNDRGFHALVYNPLNHMVPVPMEVTITSVYADLKWFFPKLKNGHVLVVPLEGGSKPNCVLFVKEANKVNDPIDIAELFE